MEFEIYSTGLCYASVCTALDVDAATARLNAESPTGLEHGWRLSSAQTFKGGEPHPLPCPRCPGNWHLLFEC